MAHYAFLDENNIVINIIQGTEETELIEDLHPEVWYANFSGKTCKRTSYNTHGNIHSLGGTPFRYNYAEIDGIFDSNKGSDGAFIPIKPFESWSLDENCVWQAPTPKPTDDKFYLWSEEILSWIDQTQP